MHYDVFLSNEFILIDVNTIIFIYDIYFTYMHTYATYTVPGLYVDGRTSKFGFVR